MKTRLLGNFSLFLFISLLAACGGGGSGDSGSGSGSDSGIGGLCLSGACAVIEPPPPFCISPNSPPGCIDLTPPPLPPPNPDGFNDKVNSIAPALDNSDNVYVGGRFTFYKNSEAVRIARFSNDGSLDAGFATGTGFIGSGMRGTVHIIAPVLDGSGDVYVGGDIMIYNGTAVRHIARLNLDGTLDSDFDTGTGFSNTVHIIAPALDGSGDVYVGGSFKSYNGIDTFYGIVRLNDDGSLDSGFQTGGTMGRNIIVPANDGSGDVYVTRSQSPRILRLNNDGSIDAGFIDIRLSGFNDDVRAIAVATDGSGDVYVAGYFSDYNGTATNGLARLNSDGSLDAGFVTDPGFTGWGNFITPTIDGSGDIYTDSNVLGDIVRINDDGSIDTGFDTGPVGFNASPSCVALATDGSSDVYVGGPFVSYNSTTTARMARLTAGGVLIR
jgi:uncharacterized delta-60 repeat protein